MIARKAGIRNIDGERSGWVKRATREEDTGELPDEEGKTNADGCQEGALVLLHSEQKDREAQTACEEHLNDCGHVSTPLLSM